MKKNFFLLSRCILFNDFNEEVIENMISQINYRVHNFSKGEIIALEGEKINSIGIILEGNIGIEKSYPSGKVICINKMESGGIFGEVIIFSQLSTYPSTIISLTKSEVLFISKENILKLCSINNGFLLRFMNLLSNKILMLNKKLKELSYGTIREKLADFILKEYKKQKKIIIEIKQKRGEMAEHFGVTRPSLSRELINMKNEGLIDFTKNTITIINLEAIENILF